MGSNMYGQVVSATETKMSVVLTIVNQLYKSGYITETDMRQAKDIALTTLYDFSIFPMECTSLVSTDEEEFTRFCEFYKTKKYIAGLKADSIEIVLYTVGKFHEFIGKKLSDVTSNDVDKYLVYSRLQRNNKKSTVQGFRLNLSSFYTLLYKNKLIKENPMDGVDPIKAEIVYEAVLTRTEITKLEEVCKSYRERSILFLLLETGLRIAECANLDIGDIDFQKTTVFVRQGKGGKDRTVPLGEKSMVLLKKYWTYERPDIDIDNIDPTLPVFAITRSPYRKAKKDSLGGIIKELGIRANIPRLHPHLLRKTYATTLYKQGIQINVITKLLGHANLESIHRYVIVNDTDVRSALNGAGIV